MHVLACFAPFYISGPGILAMIILHYLTFHLGLILCYHRMVSHQMFVAKGPLKHLLLLCASLSLEGGPINWARTHRIHHRFADTQLDPHSSLRGLFWSHIGWLLFYDSREEEKYSVTRELDRDPSLKFYERNFVLINILFLCVVAAIVKLTLNVDPFAFLIWAFPLRIVTVWHSSWLVNSLGHAIGERPHEVKNRSANNVLLKTFTLGEGLHNNHHAEPWNPNFGESTREFDLSYRFLVAWEALRLVEVKRRRDMPV
ncbi:MAG TPA: fatty acid desaturase [Bacteroidota bacterium]|nr:fatty acid desaturase [Bacteroidota bacterium]